MGERRATVNSDVGCVKSVFIIRRRWLELSTTLQVCKMNLSGYRVGEITGAPSGPVRRGRGKGKKNEWDCGGGSFGHSVPSASPPSARAGRARWVNWTLMEGGGGRGLRGGLRRRPLGRLHN